MEKNDGQIVNLQYSVGYSVGNCPPAMQMRNLYGWASLSFIFSPLSFQICLDIDVQINRLSSQRDPVRLVTNKICGDKSPSLNQAPGCQNKMKVDCREEHTLYALRICSFLKQQLNMLTPQNPSVDNIFARSSKFFNYNSLSPPKCTFCDL